MAIAAKLVQDDMTILVEGDDGQYYLKAGCVLLAGSWKLTDKMHLPLAQIHLSGHVPMYKEKLQVSMDRFFSKMQPEKLVVRHNYFFQTDGNLAWSKIMGSEDSDDFGWHNAPDNPPIEQCYFRTERQTLRRLPRTGALLFTVRTYLIPVTELYKEPYAPGKLAAAVRGWSEEVAEYKGLRKYEKTLLEYLDNLHKEQVMNGLDIDAEPQQYPF